jgi:uncharacterized membrane protein YgaE (UPF0421/DUF939 family)
LTVCTYFDLFATGLEAGLRTGLAAAASIFWGEYGPFPNKLNFFAPVIAIVCTLETAGQSLEAQFGVMHGAAMGAVLAFLTEVRSLCSPVTRTTDFSALDFQ